MVFYFKKPHLNKVGIFLFKKITFDRRDFFKFLILSIKKHHCSGGDLLSQGSGPSIIGAGGLNF